MKTNVIKTMAIIATLMFCGLPQNAISQENNNKVKKVDYLGHKYKGQVNADKIPDGKGYITVGDFYIAGIFEGSTVSEATVSKTHGDGADFLGTVKFDASNQIELKAGGVYVVPYRNYFNTKERLVTRDTLRQDKIVDSDSFEPSSASVIREVFPSKMSRSLNPPSSFYIKVPLRKGEYTIYGSPEKHIGFIEDDCMDERRNVEKELFKINKFKDNQGRVWDYERGERAGRSVAFVSYKVTYPNGNYYSHEDERFDQWKINFPDGTSLTSEGIYTIPEGVFSFHFSTRFESTDDFLKLSNSKEIHKARSFDNKLDFTFNNSDFLTMSNDAIETFVKEKLMPYIDGNNDTEITLISKDGVEIGKYNYGNGQYVSKIEREAAEEAKRKAEEAKTEKERKAKLAPYIKGFGFNPSGKSIKELVTVGRSYSLVRDFVNDYYVGGQNFWFSFAEDTGISKGYRVIRNNKRVGIIYVQNNRIISVRWY